MERITVECRQRMCVAAAAINQMIALARPRGAPRSEEEQAATWDIVRCATATVRLTYAFAWDVGGLDPQACDLVLAALIRFNHQSWKRRRTTAVPAQIAAIDALTVALADVMCGEVAARATWPASPLDPDLARWGEVASAIARTMAGDNSVEALHLLVGMALLAMREY